MTNEQKTEAPDLDDLIYAAQMSCQCAATDRDATTVEEVERLRLLLEARHKAAVGAAVRACAEAILHDHTKPDDNRLWGDERPYICEESAYRTILALEPDAQQALDKLLAEKDAEIARKHGALKAVRDRMDQLGGFDGRFTLRKIIDAALEGE